MALGTLGCHRRSGAKGVQMRGEAYDKHTKSRKAGAGWVCSTGGSTGSGAYHRSNTKEVVIFWARG